MLTEIENGLIEFLEGKGLDVRAIDIRNESDGLIKPRLNVQSLNISRFMQVDNDHIKAIVDITIYAMFKSLKDDKSRRQGLYPIVEGVLASLLYQNLDLDINDIQPVSAINITPNPLVNTNILYSIKFQPAL